uniref:Uncharacterized protein n=1 Tax=Tetranychus urticae TaxID=32264 RepID=T1L5U0_TETUR
MFDDSWASLTQLFYCFTPRFTDFPDSPNYPNSLTQLLLRSH